VAKDSARDEGDVAAIDGVGTQGARGAGAEAPLAKDLAGEVGQQPGAELLVDGAGVEGAEPVPPELLEGDAVDLVGVRAARGDLLPGGACDLLERGKEVAGLREIAIVVDEGAVGVETEGVVGWLGAVAVLEDPGDPEGARHAAVSAVKGNGLAVGGEGGEDLADGLGAIVEAVGELPRERLGGRGEGVGPVRAGCIDLDERSHPLLVNSL
jgi:hypothetical protein